MLVELSLLKKLTSRHPKRLPDGKRCSNMAGKDMKAPRDDGAISSCFKLYTELLRSHASQCGVAKLVPELGLDAELR